MFNKLFSLAVSGAFAASAWAADANASQFSKDEMVKTLQTLRQQATQVAAIAKDRQSTAHDVRSPAEAAHEAAAKLRAMVKENPEFFGPSGSERLEHIELSANVMEVVASNKLNMLEAYSEKGNRQAVRAKARNLADRAERLERMISGRS